MRVAGLAIFTRRYFVKEAIVQKKNNASVMLGCVVFLFCFSIHALDNGVALTPPMGWNSWNTFGMYPSDQLIRETADAMVSSGMKDAGYRYVCIDDGWIINENDNWKRDSNGGLVAQSSFSDMRALTSYIHNKGLKIGIYLACYPCMNHEEQDADSLVAWGFDYLKYDFCEAVEKKARMRDALKNAVQRARDGGNTTVDEIVYSLSLDFYDSWLFSDTIANLWRTNYDIDPGGNWNSMLNNADANAPLYSYAGPGGWNDADMLVVGKGLPVGEDRAHFSLWCIMASPLIAGNDIRNMSSETIEILTNSELIAVDQDSLGKQGRKIKAGNTEVWAKELKNGRIAVCFLNRGTGAADISITWTELGDGLEMNIPSAASFHVKDLWQHAEKGEYTGSYTAENVPGHDVEVVLLSSDLTQVCREAGSGSRSSAAIRYDGISISVYNESAQGGFFQLFDSKGKIVRTQHADGGKCIMPVHNLQPGLYLFRAQTSGGNFSEKILIHGTRAR